MSAALPRRPRQSAYTPLHTVSATLAAAMVTPIIALRYIQNQKLVCKPIPGKEK